MSSRKTGSISSFAVLKVFHETSTTFVTMRCWQDTPPAKQQLVVRLSKRLQKPLICCRVQVGFKQEKNAKLRQGSFLLRDARSCGRQVTRRTIRKKTTPRPFLSRGPDSALSTWSFDPCETIKAQRTKNKNQRPKPQGR